jgi:hypothetical protein
VWGCGRAATGGIEAGTGCDLAVSSGAVRWESSWASSCCGRAVLALLLRLVVLLWLGGGGGWTKTARGVKAEEADTVRGRNGVAKGIAVQGRMITENSLRPHERQHVGTLPG